MNVSRQIPTYRVFVSLILSVGAVAWTQAACLRFDGLDDHIYFGDVLDLSGPFTLEAWVLLEPGATGRPPTWDDDVIAKVGGVTGNYGYELAYDIDSSPDVLACNFNTAGGGWPQYQATGTVKSIHGLWTHLAATYDGDTLAVYRNGVQVGAKTVGSQVIADTASPLLIGTNANNMNYWQGWIDEVRIWNLARQEAELRSTMYRPPQGTEPGLIGYWNFETGYGGDTAYDVTNGGHNGTLRNGVKWSSLNAPRADIWGVKSQGRGVLPGSQPPATLFRFKADGSEFAVVAPITVGGEEIDVDALALSPEGTLFGFQLDAAGARLVTIDLASAVATPAGSFLEGRDIRGAAFTISGRLFVLDAATDEVLEIDPATGGVLGQGMRLSLNGSPFGLPDYCDLVQSHDGSFVMGTENNLFSLDVTSGDMTLLSADPNSGPDGVTVGIDGLAFSPIAEDVQSVFIYDISLEDDIYVYDRTSGYSRTHLHRNIISSYNAGRGDVASLPAGRSEIRAWTFQEAGLALETVCRPGVYAWVEMTEDLSAGAWQILPNSVTLIPEIESLYNLSLTWPGLPGTPRVGFFRIGTLTENPTGD
jgi:hypothetical protein